MNKEEFKSLIEYHNEMKEYYKRKEILYIYSMSKQIIDLQSQLDIANKKLDKIKECVNKSIKPEYRNGNSNEFYLEMNEKEVIEFLSIIGDKQ